MHVVQVASTSRPATRRPSGNVPFSGSEKGQAVTALLAAYSYNPCPLIFDLTDGEVIKVLLFPVLDPVEILLVTSLCAYFAGPPPVTAAGHGAVRVAKPFPSTSILEAGTTFIREDHSLLVLD